MGYGSGEFCSFRQWGRPPKGANMTAATIYRSCCKNGIFLAADGDTITFDAPGEVAVPVDQIRSFKAELLAVLNGEYLKAALELVRGVSDQEERHSLTEYFEERAGICQYEGGMSPAEA